METYEEYLEHIKKLSSIQNVVGFVKLLDINLPKSHEKIIDSKRDPFVNAVKWSEFKRDLLNRGTFWAMIIADYEVGIDGRKIEDRNGYWLIEGFHRYKAFKELIEEGLLPKDFKVLCVFNKPDNFEAEQEFCEMMKCCYAYRFLDVSRLVAHREINEFGFYWNMLE